MEVRTMISDALTLQRVRAFTLLLFPLQSEAVSHLPSAFTVISADSNESRQRRDEWAREKAVMSFEF